MIIELNNLTIKVYTKMSENQENIWSFLSHSKPEDMPTIVLYIWILYILYHICKWIFISINLARFPVNEFSGEWINIKINSKSINKNIDKKLNTKSNNKIVKIVKIVKKPLSK